MTATSINLRHLFALSHIAATGRLSAAAELLFMSQSGLTQALRKLEDTCGAQLFERSGFGVTETEAGHLLVRRADRSIALLVQAERIVRARFPRTTLPSPLYRHCTSSQLRALIAVVDTGGYTAAARQLGLAQPTVHRAVRDLDALFGNRLFRRTAQGVEPSDTARLIARFAELVFAEIRQGLEEVGELAGRTDSRIAVGSLPLARSEFLPAAVTQLLEQFPDARVTIHDGPYAEQLRALRHGQIDWLIGALRDPAPAPDIVQVALFEQPLTVVVRPGHPLLKNRNPDAEDLSRLKWVLPRPQVPARILFKAYFDKNEVAGPTHIIDCDSLVATRELVQRSDRAALLSPMQVRSDIASGQLAMLSEAIPGTARSIGFAIRENWKPTRVQAAFGGILRDLAASIAHE